MVKLVEEEMPQEPQPPTQSARLQINPADIPDPFPGPREQAARDFERAMAMVIQDDETYRDLYNRYMSGAGDFDARVFFHAIKAEDRDDAADIHNRRAIGEDDEGKIIPHN
ncbi:hypothetical protein L596_006141 [Steinernema carpocapsae]|uniref:Uncharacterized protein n=1 Tax=Steinernema carpocapsae TaxID=34508 RepID=A0A4U8V179_STECR|nr:hypothetical protein L596_006141 [Steinernema carpocapsae]